jgi:hypothetical protein
MILCTAVLGCYAVPATHVVDPEPSEAGEGDADAVEDDAGVAPGDAGGSEAGASDAGRVDGGPMDAAPPRDGAADASPGADADASRCDCKDATKPVCIESTTSCVECQEDKHCGGGKKCHVLTGTCVGCLKQSDCAGNAMASACNATSHSCVPCSNGVDSECSDVPDLHVCNAGQCVQCAGDRREACSETKAGCSASNMCEGCKLDADCTRFRKVCDEPAGACVACTPDSETAQCLGKSCNPATKACTQTNVRSVDECGKCTADSECKDADHRCVVMSYQGTQRGGYCMKRTATGCTPPYSVPHTAGSLSGAAPESYCGFDQTLTSCEAILALLSDKMCAGGDAALCGGPGAVCGTLNTTLTNRCSYGCQASADCPSRFPCPTSGSSRFCGK